MIAAGVDGGLRTIARAIRRAARGGRSAVPEDNLVLSDGHAGGRIGAVVGVLVRGDLVRECLQPGGMRVAVDVHGGISVGCVRDAGLVDGGNIVAFAPVVPAYDFDELRQDLLCFLPSVEPQAIAPPHPGFVVGWQVGVEPGGDTWNALVVGPSLGARLRTLTHHVRLIRGSQRRRPLLIRRGGHLIRAIGPHGPAESTIVKVHVVPRALGAPIRHKVDASADGTPNGRPLIHIGDCWSFERGYEGSALVL